MKHEIFYSELKIYRFKLNTGSYFDVSFDEHGFHEARLESMVFEDQEDYIMSQIFVVIEGDFMKLSDIVQWCVNKHNGYTHDCKHDFSQYIRLIR